MTDKQLSAAMDSLPRTIDWGACLAAHEHWLRKVIYARTGEQQAVDEVFQQVALAAVEQRSPLAEADKAPAWLHRLSGGLFRSLPAEAGTGTQSAGCRP